MVLPTGLYRADHVGSLLRPKEILDTRQRLANGTGTDTQADLRAVEDKFVRPIVTAQLDAGLRSVTDGELRRAWFHLDYLEHLDGVKVNANVLPPQLTVTGKLGHSKAIQVDDFRFLQNCIRDADAEGRATTKVCIPSPTMVHFRGGRASIDKEAYPTLEPDFFDDLARVYQEELADLYAAGCRFVQLDDTNLAYLCDPNMRKAAAEERSEDLTSLPRRYAQLINKAISKRPKDMTIGIHICRGNYRSKWFASGGYEPVAETLFKELDVNAYFLEYDDARSGDFAPLRFLPEGKFVVLGLMSSKHAALDDREEIVKRLHEAAGYVPLGLEQLCLSHQCGFSSTMEGNDLTEEDQWAKIRLEVEIAKEVWQDDLSR